MEIYIESGRHRNSLIVSIHGIDPGSYSCKIHYSEIRTPPFRFVILAQTERLNALEIAARLVAQAVLSRWIPRCIRGGVR